MIPEAVLVMAFSCWPYPLPKPLSLFPSITADSTEPKKLEGIVILMCDIQIGRRPRLSCRPVDTETVLAGFRQQDDGKELFRGGWWSYYR